MPPKIGYALATVALLVTEILIAAFLHRGFIREYVGDYLVVILVYCFLRTFTRGSVRGTALGTLAFAFTIEILQHFHLVRMLGLESSRLARIVLGSTFAWEDLLAYTAGIATVLVVEKMRVDRRPKVGEDS